MVVDAAASAATTAVTATAAVVAYTPVGAAIAFLGGAIGTAWAQASIGSAGMGLLAEKDGKEGNMILFLALPETLAILGFVVAYLILAH
jgi:V/A-type H+-transporting ATPase subunit K